MSAVPGVSPDPGVYSLPRIVLTVVASSIVAGALIGLLWGALVSGQQFLIAGGQPAVLLPKTELNRYNAGAIFACIGVPFGIAVALAAWQMRRCRGVTLLAAIVGAAALGAAAMAATGLGVQVLRFDSITDAVPVGQVVTTAPGMATPWMLMFAPLASAVTIAIAALLSPHDDLGVGDALYGPEEPDAELEGSETDRAGTDQVGGLSAANSSVTRNA
ncbi:MAG: DUF2567 domain-containing protein [Rhodococcus sp.]|nr:DUF2567 domain-containing protein [Rhodococcus sp. (in: high G+C Gram-positive bacteria)]